MHFPKRNPRRWTRIAWLLSVTWVLAGCFWPAPEEESLAFTLPATFSNVPLAVGSQSYTVSSGEVVRTLTFDGAVQAGTQRELYFTVDGPLTAVHVENAASVVPGDLLLELDAEDALLALDEAALLYRQAELRLEQAKTGDSYAVEVASLNLDIAQLNLQKLQWDPSVSSEQIEIAQREVDLARAALARAQEGSSGDDSVDVSIAEVQLEVAALKLKRARREVESLQLYAPITGTVRLGQELRVGFPVDAYVPVARIVDPTTVVVESNLDATEMASLYEGMPVQMEVTVLPGVLFPGEIVRLPQPYGNGSTPITQIAPDLSAGNLTLREGAGITVHAEVGRRTGVLWLPSRVIQTVAGQAYVVVREGDRLRDQAVEIGLVGDERTEIVSGLSEGQQVMGP